jgi:hypothetical protein
MAYREVTMLEVKEVLRLWLGGVPKKHIAVQLGLDVKTVRRYIGAAWTAGLRREVGPEALDDGLLATVVGTVQPGTGRPHGDGWAECTAQRAVIEAHLQAGRRLSKIRKLLRRQGVEVSYATLRRFAIAELGFGHATPTIPVADCGPGEEVQLDTGWMTHLAPMRPGGAGAFGRGSSPRCSRATASSIRSSGRRPRRRSRPARRPGPISWASSTS